MARQKRRRGRRLCLKKNRKSSRFRVRIQCLNRRVWVDDQIRHFGPLEGNQERSSKRSFGFHDGFNHRRIDYRYPGREERNPNPRRGNGLLVLLKSFILKVQSCSETPLYPTSFRDSLKGYYSSFRSLISGYFYARVGTTRRSIPVQRTSPVDSFCHSRIIRK